MESGGRQVGKSPNGTINTITSTQGEWKSEKRNEYWNVRVMFVQTDE
jgi:hypothetical protein